MGVIRNSRSRLRFEERKKELLDDDIFGLSLDTWRNALKVEVLDCWSADVAYPVPMLPGVPYTVCFPRGLISQQIELFLLVVCTMIDYDRSKSR